MFEWAYDGVNASIPRNVGPECAYYLSLKQRIIETLFISIFIISFLVWGYKRIKLPSKVSYVNQDCVGRRILLIIMSLVLGMEIGFKFTSRTVIYILNPCHITSAAQLYLLAANPSPTVTTIFRIHLNFLNGPLLAYLFPETESRRIFADKALYYIQHGLMVVIPYYLLRIGGVYNIEPLSDMSWCIFSYGINLAYHFWIIQPIALPTQVNLSHMLCAAILDPFEGQNYRMWTFIHQGLLCPLLCDKGNVTCYACKRIWGPEAFGDMSMSYTIHFNKTNVYALSKQNDEKEEAEGPIVERKCPQCQNDKMSYATLQLRSADEGQTVFYTCTKCKFKETENS